MIPAAWLALGVAAAADRPREVEATLGSEALGTLVVRLGHARTACPGGTVGVELPLTLWVADGAPDTARLVGSAHGQWTRGRLVVRASATARLGVQADDLGTRTSLDVGARAEPGLALDEGAAALFARVGGQQPLATLYTFSDTVHAAFADSGSAAPEAGVAPFGPGSLLLGLGAEGGIVPGWVLHGALDGVLHAPGLELDPLQRVAAGDWPIRAEVGVRYRW